MKKTKPLILVTNDDGISAPGIRALISVMSEIGTVVVVAPDSPQSATGHSITINNTLFINKISNENDAIQEYSTSGTPVDCVKLATNEILKRKPDLCVSGINHGSNSSINVIYSGTMSAAVEAGIEGVPAIGFSLDDYSADADFSKAKIIVAKVFQSVLENGLPPFTCLNVNIPKGKPKGIKVCRQAHGKWVEEFEKRVDPHGREYHWLSGYFKNFELDSTETDIYALENNFASVVPVTVDMTCYKTLSEIQNWKF